jgi:lipopolysaccharide transport system ATP-binding protein
MKRADILRKFDEIVSFAEIERFLDTPVKRYSSGMYTRLAFAVAAHLEPEISRLCRRAIWIDGGRISRAGDSDEVIKAYLSEETSQAPERQWTFPGDAPGDESVRLLGARALQLDRVTSVVDINTSAQVQIDFQVLRPARNLICGTNLYDSSGLCLVASCDWRPNSLRPNRYGTTVAILPYLLAEGRISVLVQLVFYEPDIQSVVVPPRSPSMRSRYKITTFRVAHWRCIRPSAAACHRKLWNSAEASGFYDAS